MIDIHNLYFSYNKSYPFIIDNLNLKINKGDYVSILGDNGAGKSTLIKLILKFLTPIKGNIKINTNKLGYVPQKIDSFNSQFPMTVAEMLECHRKALKIKDKNIVSDSLALVKMTHFKDSLIGALSGGQRQKIFIARALIGNPELLILDEPSTGIDIKSQLEIYSLIKKLNLEYKITVISIEHNIEAAIKNSSHIYRIKDGKGILYAPKDYELLVKGGNIHAAL